MTMDGRNKQEVRLKLGISLTIRAEHNVEDIKDILMRGIYNSFPNNPLIVNELAYAEERDIHFENFVKWTDITDQYKEKNESK
jgi:hypothetical protein